MSQLYIAQNTPLQCSKGRRLIGVAVSSQSTVKLKNGGKLMATEKDRFKDNFICPEMMMAGAIAGVAVAAAFSGGLFVLAVGAFAGSALIDDVLNICSLLCKGSKWDGVHDKVKAEGKKALLQKSTLNCFIGGKITFFLPPAEAIQEALIASAMAQDAYNENAESDDSKLGDYERVDTSNQEALDALFGENVLLASDFNTNKENGFYAALYHNPKTGKYFVSFRGSEPSGMQFYHDWAVEDGGQAFGAHTPQIEKTRYLAEKIDEATNGNTIFTGHSLGGGNSAMAGYQTGAKSYTFNARGLHQNTLDYLDKNNALGTTDNIINYSTSNDILNALQNNREGLLATIATLPTRGLGKLLNLVGIGGSLTGAVPRVIGEQNEMYGYGENNEGMSLKMFGAGHSAYDDAINAMMETMNTTVIANNS